MGKYVDEHLIKDEHVIYEAKLHWIIFVSVRALFTLWISPIVAYTTNEYAITNKRVIVKEGLISRKTIEMKLSKVETVNVDQTIIGRIFGYGTITIVGTGGTKEQAWHISNPMDFRKEFQEISS